MIASWVKKGGGFRQRLGIFAKQPLPGRVKTRLSPFLGREEAAEFYRLSLRDTVDRMTRAGFDPVIFFAGEEGFFRRAFPSQPLKPQAEGDLGFRMATALEGELTAGAQAAILIGSDCPDLPLCLVERAFDVLCKADVVIAPAVDGGYVLIGESRHHPELFRGVPWGGPAVMTVTRRIACRLRLSLIELEMWEDVDDSASLRRFVRRSPELSCARFAAGLAGCMNAQREKGAPT